MLRIAGITPLIPLLNLMICLGTAAAGEPDSTIFEPLPIVSYDTDTGFGYGAKAFLLNPLRHKESFDLILFNSTKGEHWYRFVFSIPDFELRQGTVYPVALDLILDYDRYIARSYFGIGSGSRYEDREKYTRRDIEIAPALTRGISERLIAQIGYRYKRIISDHFDPAGEMQQLPAVLNNSQISNNALFSAIRYDSRNSFIDPDSGIVLLGEIEVVRGTTDFLRWALWFQNYITLPGRQITVASRLGLETLDGDNLPLQVLLPIGGNQSLRGYAQDRFLDRTRALINLEIRFPIIWNFGGVAGLDLGKVWPSVSSVDLKNWPLSPVLGLRYYFRTYIVRADVGVSSESIGFYFNFGHVF